MTFSLTLRRASVLLTFALLILPGAACSPASGVELAHFTENSVEVTIRLEKTSTGGDQLSALFTPPAGFHLYSKDLPRTGVDGLGRPTLLELPQPGLLLASGPLMENIRAETPAFEPRDLLVYPSGPVTLSLPVKFPETTQPFNVVISVTYMACSNNGCKPPVVAKQVRLTIKPGDWRKIGGP